jgi:hypothetical protein
VNDDPKRKLCDKCLQRVRAENAEADVARLHVALETLVTWYDERSAGFRKRACPPIWDKARKVLEG